MLDVAVVIPCHNYGKFLPDAINCLLKQSYKPVEVVVVDDSSSDNTAQVAAEAARFGVKYLRVDHRSLALTRKAGFEATKAEILFFLDADDIVFPNYIRAGVERFYASPGVEHHRLAMVYSDICHFGLVKDLRKRFQSKGLEHLPDDHYIQPSNAVHMPMTQHFDPELIEHVSYMHAGSLVRRRALEQHPEVWHHPGHHYHEDWWMFRCLCRSGWQAAKQNDYYHYRVHGEQMTHEVFKQDYFQRSACGNEQVTIFTPFSGREHLLPRYFAWLENQHWPAEQTHLWFYNTSRNPRFEETLRGYLANCKYRNHRYTHSPLAADGLADMPRGEHAHEVRRVCARIYNDMSTSLDTPHVLIVEDDIIPPLDVIRGGFESFTELTAAVLFPFKSRFHEGYAMCRPGQENPFVPILERGKDDVEIIGGGGFGCVLLKRAVLWMHGFTHYSTEPRYSDDFDVSFWQRLRDHGRNVVTNWNYECEHLDSPVQAQPIQTVRSAQLEAVA